MDTNNRNNKSILLVVVAIALAIVAFFLIRSSFEGQLPFISQGESPSDQHENVSGENGESDSETSSEEGDNNPGTSSGSSSDSAIKPNIPVTPYTVYIGFAQDLETATELPPGVSNEVVIGYEWQVLFPSPPFASVTLPEWNANNPSVKYTVEVWDVDEEVYEILGAFPSGEEIDFPREGLLGALRFRVTGIDPSLSICPNDRSFDWQVRLTFEGDMGLVRTPITRTLPAGETCQMR